MVKRIIQIVDDNVDHSVDGFPLGSVLFGASESFRSAILKLRDVCRDQKYLIPEKLKCL